MAASLIPGPSHMDPSRFHVGSARWRASLDALITPLIPLLDAHIAPWPSVFASPYAVRRQIGTLWTAWLRQAQGGRCFWCQGRLFAGRTTIEHVLPYNSRGWQGASRIEQLLSLRVSHPACNRAYAQWRSRQPNARLEAMDRALLRLVRQAIRSHPVFRLGAH